MYPFLLFFWQFFFFACHDNHCKLIVYHATNVKTPWNTVDNGEEQMQNRANIYPLKKHIEHHFIINNRTSSDIQLFSAVKQPYLSSQHSFNNIQQAATGQQCTVHRFLEANGQSKSSLHYIMFRSSVTFSFITAITIFTCPL